MFKHEKMLFHPVAVEKPNPQYAALLQEQLGGANGELKAAMQYMSQSFRIKDPEIKDLFLDILRVYLHISMCLNQFYGIHRFGIQQPLQIHYRYHKTLPRHSRAKPY